MDIVDGSRWPGDPWKASPGFWDALGQESKKLGLVWGGYWRMRDYPHVQGVPVSVQNRFRAMAPSQRAGYVV